MRTRLHRLYQSLTMPSFHFTGTLFEQPYIEKDCEFAYPSRISLGKHVRFLKGAVVQADPEGEIHLEDGAMICRYCVVQSVGGSIRIGKRSLVGDFCSLYGQGGLHIGADVMLASGCRVVPNQHTFDQPGIPVSQLPCTSKGITIGDGAWLGTNVVVLDGTRIGNGAVIGAGAVVVRDIPDDAIAVGVPARVVRKRGAR